MTRLQLLPMKPLMTLITTQTKRMNNQLLKSEEVILQYQCCFNSEISNGTDRKHDLFSFNLI